MSAPAFDTLSFAQTLRDGDFQPKQAEALSRAIVNLFGETGAATRQDIAASEDRLSTRVAAVETRVAALDAKLDAKFTALDTNMTSKLAALEASLGRTIADSRNVTLTWAMATIIALLIAVGSVGALAYNVGRGQIPVQPAPSAPR